MKIVFLLTEVAVGGAERVVLDLCTQFKMQGHKVSVIALKSVQKNDIMVQAFRNEGVKIYSLNVDKKHFYRILGLKRLVYALAPNVVSSHLFHPNLFSRLFLGNRNFKLINTIHIMEIRPSQKWRFAADFLTFRSADLYTAVSQAVADFQEKALHLNKGTIKVIRNGIRPVKLLDDNEIIELRKKWGVDDCDYVLGSVGRLNYQKGYDLLLNMTEAICKEIKNRKIGLVFIGDGPEREKLEKLAQNAPRRMKIVFAGYSDNAASECGAFDVFLMPSRFEGMPLSLIEAQAHGIAIVAQNIPTITETLTHYPNVLITDFEHTPYIAAQNIADALKNKRLAAVYVPTIEKMAEVYMKFFKEF